ncbi:hypothetical protein D3C73_1182620 [compost metagenome]
MQMEGVPLNAQLNQPRIGHIQHGLVARRQTVSPLGIHNRFSVVESVQIIPGHRSAGGSMIAFLEVAAHADISVAEREHALAPLIILIRVGILTETPFPVWI